jgi:DNA-directed RNA polymerase specialized sigma24 family protein
MCEDITISNRAQEHRTVFDARFSRSRGLLRFIACRVLGTTQAAENAVQTCWLRASRNPPKFEHEGAFRSWLLRILIDEALALLRKKKESAGDGSYKAHKMTT